MWDWKTLENAWVENAGLKNMRQPNRGWKTWDFKSMESVTNKT